MANNFLPFCGTDTGTNLPTQGDYAVDPNRDIGNSPGVASSKLNNKPLRQATFVASQLAQFVSDRTGADTLDDGNTTRFLQQIKAAIQQLAPNVTRITGGSGNWNMCYQFFIVAGNATAGATYTNNGVTYTVVETIAAGTILKASGNGDPTASGTLTKASGTGDATITFYARRKPLYLEIEAVGGGAGGSSGVGGSGAANGSAGGNTTFGTLITCNGGPGTSSHNTNVNGGTATAGAGLTVMQTIDGPPGQSGGTSSGMGGQGGSTPYGGAGGGGYAGTQSAKSALPNTGAGGGGGGGASGNSGAGGSAGGYLRGIVGSPASTYAYAVGAAGAAGTNGVGNGGTGGSGVIVVKEHYQ